MRPPMLILGTLTLLLLIIVPASGAPPLQKGSQTSYNLSVSISFNQSCQPILGATFSAGIDCPMIAMISPGLNINGTLGWTIADLNSTTANLNVTRDITTSSGEVFTALTNHLQSFNESINLATRIASILPFIEPEMDQALRMAETSMGISLPTGTSWSSTMLTIDGTMIRPLIHTMWWVNGPIKPNDTVPVLLFSTNVTGSTSVAFPSPIGTRTAWSSTLNKTRSLLPPSPLATMSPSLPSADGFKFGLTFNYDQTSDLLLSASADIHLGFGEETFIQSTLCDSSATTAPTATVCPAKPVPVMREFGIDVQAALKLSSTTLDLNQRLTTGTGGGQGSGAGSGTGFNSGSNSASGSGSNPGSGGSTTGAGQPPSNPAQPQPMTQSATLLPWMFGILGVVATAIIASSVWIARGRKGRNRSQVLPAQPSI